MPLNVDGTSKILLHKAAVPSQACPPCSRSPSNSGGADRGAQDDFSARARNWSHVEAHASRCSSWCMHDACCWQAWIAHEVFHMTVCMMLAVGSMDSERGLPHNCVHGAETHT